MLWPLSVVPVANTNGRLAIPALAGLLVNCCCTTDLNEEPGVRLFWTSL